MTWQQALPIYVARTGVTRYNELCSESHPQHRAYRYWIMQQVYPTVVTGQAGSLHKLPLSLSVQVTTSMKGCPHWQKCSTGCGRATCKIGKFGTPDPRVNDGSTLVTMIDCGTCLYPDNEDLKKIRGE